MTFARSDHVLHLLREDGVPCGAVEWKVTEEPIGRDDVICGSCLDASQPAEDEISFGETVGQLVALPYEIYLRSHHWQTIRRAALDHYGPACLLCGETGQVDVHHRTYERRGHERLHDLTVLCRDCHGRFHEAA